jgi:hypothetical protein
MQVSLVIGVEISGDVSVPFEDVDDFEAIIDIAKEDHVVPLGVLLRSGNSSGRGRPRVPGSCARCSHLATRRSTKRSAVVRLSLAFSM